MLFYKGDKIKDVYSSGKLVTSVYHGGELVYSPQDVPDDGYVKRGLVSRYKGSRNTRSGHNEVSLVWEDLVGSADLLINPASLTPAHGWGEDHFWSVSNKGTWFTIGGELPSGFSVESFTVEVVIKATASSSTGGGGDVWSFNGILDSPYTSVDNEVYGNNLRFYASETSAYTQVGSNQALVLNNMYSISTQVQPYSGGSGRKKLWLNGAKKIDAARTAETLYVPDKNPNMLYLMGNGGSYPTISQVFFGNMYEVRVYNSPLIDSEVAQNYARDREVYSFL